MVDIRNGCNDCNDLGVGSLKICVGSANKKLETQQDQICQAFLFNLQFTKEVASDSLAAGNGEKKEAITS